MGLDPNKVPKKVNTNSFDHWSGTNWSQNTCLLITKYSAENLYRWEGVTYVITNCMFIDH